MTDSDSDSDPNDTRCSSHGAHPPRNRSQVSSYAAGWSWPIQARKAHYFQAGQIRSVCDQWLYAGYRDPSMEPSKDECVACRRWVTKNTAEDTPT